MTEEVPYKQWRQEEAMRADLTSSAIWYRVRSGRYPGLHLRRVNARVVWARDDTMPHRMPQDAPRRDFGVRGG